MTSSRARIPSTRAQGSGNFPGPLFSATAATAASATASAQTPGPLFQSQSITRDSTPDPDARVWQRFVSATVVGALGAVTLGTIGSQVGRPHDIFQVMAGILAGGTIGSAIGAALPRGRGLCSGSRRFGKGLGGASLGLVTGIGFVRIPPLDPLFMVTIPVGSVMFMGKC